MLLLCCPQQAVSHQLNAVTEDMYTNGSAAPGGPGHTKDMRKVRLIQFEKVTEEPMVMPCCSLAHCFTFVLSYSPLRAGDLQRKLNCGQA